MHVTAIELTDFRNYRSQQITVHPDINVFFGANAQGKTNILEAVYLCACARSHRTSRDADLIHQEGDHYAVKVDFITQSGHPDSLEIRYFDPVPGHPQRQKPIRQIYQNGVLLERISDMMGLFHAVIFAPEDLMLIKEGPATRRRFLDLLISQVRPTYFQDLQRYSRLLQQRNKILKDLREAKSAVGSWSETDQLEAWDLTMVPYAARIIHQRMHYVQRLDQFAEKNHSNISSGKEKLNVKYRTISGYSHETSIPDLSDLLIRKYKSTIYEDIARGSTQTGPHRDDLEFVLQGEAMKPYASQGQQRSAVLSLKLSELEIITEDIGERPVLLLDDVMSELDTDRRRCLLESISQAQVFVTCTDANHVVADIRLADQSKQLSFSQGVADSSQTTSQDRQFSFYEVRSGQVTRVEQEGSFSDIL
ncbi:MAG: DNA replication/repair protein RecF [Eubacteriales bacterium]|nr:DNA replication/repair protein RecF [Eubacteriales bacterium]